MKVRKFGVARHWKHYFGRHLYCHPAKCETAARICNQLWAENEEDYL